MTQREEFTIGDTVNHVFCDTVCEPVCGRKKTLFDSLCNRAGFGDLKPADRSGDKPLQRQAVWYIMREKNITFEEIAKQSHRTHGTIVVGVKRFKDYLSINDEESRRIYRKLKL